MLDDETTAQQQSLLATYRRTLAHLVAQAAQYGGEPFAPPPVVSGIHEAREQIRRLKGVLRTNGVTVSDHPDDELPVAEISQAAPASATAQTAARDPHTGRAADETADQRQGVFVSGGQIGGPVVGVNSGTVATTYRAGVVDATSAAGLDQALVSIHQASIAARQRGDNDLADDLDVVFQSLQAARKAQQEDNAERRATKLRAAQQEMTRIAGEQPALQAQALLIQQLR